jgi:transcriptional regulator with XRE-family HTH domain
VSERRDSVIKVNIKNLILARAKAGLSTEEVAKKAELGRVTISKLQNGTIKPNPVTIGKLARALNIPVEDLIIFEEK